jgi:hypothetical protein
MLTMDIPADAPPPKRGDLVQSPGTLYYVLSAIQVKRRDPEAPRRYTMKVAKAGEIEPELIEALVQSADRRGGSNRYRFVWDKREKKSKSFESLMRGDRT